MKKRYLRKDIETLLTIITLVLVLLIATLNQINLASVPYLLIAISIVIINVYILKTWGRGIYE